MANDSRKMGFPQFFTDTESADGVRRQFLEVPTEAAGQAAIGSAMELAEFLGKLPEAFVASQRRELSRVQKSAEEDDTRIEALKTSIEQAEALQVTARRGQVRAQRSLLALADNKDVFHGFVSNTALEPLKGLTVRLIDSNHPRVSPQSATTDEDGYFNIPLGTKRKAGQDLSHRIIAIFTGLGTRPDAAPTGAAATTRRVDILKRSTLLHSDPILVTLEGSIFREYVIADTEPASDSDYREFASPPGEPRKHTTAGSRGTRPTKRKSKK